MTIQTKLSQIQEREVALAYLCGVNIVAIKKEYGISDSTIRQSILDNRSREWQDPLIEFYRKTNPFKKDINFAHMFLSFQKGIDPPKPTGLIEFWKDDTVYGLVRDHIYQPGIEAVLERTRLNNYSSEKDPYDKLIAKVFGIEDYAEDVVNDLFLTALHNSYKLGDKLSIKDIIIDVSDTIIKKVKEGGLYWSKKKKELVHKVLETLSPREEKIIKMKFGLGEYQHGNTNLEIASEFGVSDSRINQIYQKSIRKLRHPSTSIHLKFFTYLSTDTDAKSYLDIVDVKYEVENWARRNIKEPNPLDSVSQDIRNIKIRDLNGLSVRIRNSLATLNIRTIGDFDGKTETELLKGKNFGRTSLIQLKSILAQLGVMLKQ